MFCLSISLLRTPANAVWRSVSRSSTATDRWNAGPHARDTRKGAFFDCFVQVNIEIGKTATRADASVAAQNR
jgi:hypothetical protein